MNVTYFGHSCFQVELQGKKLLFDPFISPNELAKDINADDIEADYILVSHGHEDHVADLKSIAKRTGAKVISNFEIISWLEEQGVENGHPMNHGGEWDFEFGTVKYVNAVHSSVLPDGTYGGNAGGFVIRSKEKCFYYAGDTALTYDMKILGEHEKLNVAFLPIGNNFTMGVKDAIIASEMIECTRIIPMHYDTFPYIEVGKESAKEEFDKANVELLFMDIGETNQF